jgi:hypothetical protein
MSIKYEKENGHDVIVVMRDTKPLQNRDCETIKDINIAERETKTPSQNKMTNYKIIRVGDVQVFKNGIEMVSILNRKSGMQHVGFISKNGKVEIISGRTLKTIKI